MIGGTDWPLEARPAAPADRQKSIGEAEALFLTNASQPLACWPFQPVPVSAGEPAANIISLRNFLRAWNRRRDGL